MPSRKDAIVSNFIEELKARRSQYALTSESPVSDQEIVKTVEDVTVQVSSAFNSQPQRAVVLFGDANQKLWNIVKELIDEAVAVEFGLPSSWVLQAQMPFGTVAQAAAPVDKQPVDSRVKVFGL